MNHDEKNWEEVEEACLTIAERCVYRTRRRAVELYRKGISPKEIFYATGIRHMAVLRLWERCCATDPDTGRCAGYQALVPKSKIKRFIR